MQPESNGPALKTCQTCQTAAHAVCAIDLLPNTQAKALTPLVFHTAVSPGALTPHQASVRVTSTQHLLRSSSPPLITALRV